MASSTVRSLRSLSRGGVARPVAIELASLTPCVHFSVDTGMRPVVGSLLVWNIYSFLPGRAADETYRSGSRARRRGARDRCGRVCGRCAPLVADEADCLGRLERRP